jgi:hypothetical protein
MAVLNLEQQTPPTDTTVLGRYYLLAPTEELEKAVKSLQFELEMRANRDAIGANQKAVSAARRQEIEEALASVEKGVFDVEAEGL